ncbi:hypothetical protein GCM10010169_48510 [Micromonospora fulviviridis]|uniref:hypothetical protein n=1 Tax=Micromonospora fulviviridis TaxID=47860 RepID=UPI00166AE91E|nr:hypothetical protein [Micromonospora fulviviridis]GGR98244.1 hypothetical protein GCM10010169_48510 [Micromonospora fulviviridis]
MNEILSPVWDEHVRRLRLGIAPRDALSGRDVFDGLDLHLEDVPRPHPVRLSAIAAADDAIGLPRIRPNPSGRFAIAFGGPSTDRPRLVLRIVDSRRRYVPRRLSVPVPHLATVRAFERGHDIDPTRPLAARACRPVLFPGADHGALPSATVLRGRVTWGAGGPPAPWVRVEARPTAGHGPVRWRGHGDDRGEFVLVIGALPLQLAKRPARTVDVEVVVRARPLPPSGTPVDSPAGSREDPLWHLPIEPVGNLDPADGVSTGAAVPAGYTKIAVQTVRCWRGGVTRPPPFVLT